MKEIKQFSVQKDANLLEGLKKINSGTDGILLVVDGLKLIGILTDGDFRRLLLNGISLEEPILKHSNKKFIYSESSETTNERLSKLSRSIKHLPVLNKSGEVVDLLTFNDLLLVNVSNPDISDNEKKYVLDALNSGWISSQGDYVKRFEKELISYLSSPDKKINLTTTPNGTAALELVLKSLNIKYGDEVILPSITFGATANSIINVGAKPVFVDVDIENFNINIDEIKTNINSKTKAIIIVHLYGNPVAIDLIQDLCKKNNIYLIEDAAEALGTKYKNRYCGTFGDAAIFSFYANKLITTGEGGAAVLKSDEHFSKALSIKNHGMDKNRKYWHNHVGSNYRLTNIQAALGLAQMEKIDFFLESRKEMYNIYQHFFSQNENFMVPKVLKDGTSSFWLYPIVEKPNSKRTLKDLSNHLKKDSIETRPVFPPLHLQDAFKNFSNKKLNNSEKYFMNGICLPIFNNMSIKERTRIKESLERFFL